MPRCPSCHEATLTWKARINATGQKPAVCRACGTLLAPDETVWEAIGLGFVFVLGGMVVFGDAIYDRNPALGSAIFVYFGLGCPLALMLSHLVAPLEITTARRVAEAKREAWESFGCLLLCILLSVLCFKLL